MTTASLEEPADTWHFEAVKATLKRDSRLKTVEDTDGAEAETLMTTTSGLKWRK